MGSFDNARKKLIVSVWPSGHSQAGEIVIATNVYVSSGKEVPWSHAEPGVSVEDADGAETVAVGIVECDGASKLNLGRIGTGDGKNPECILESCMEVSADRSSPQDLPIFNTFAQARSLVRCAREQGFPMRRLHHHTHDHKRIHCIGRLVRA